MGIFWKEVKHFRLRTIHSILLHRWALLSARGFFICSNTRILAVFPGSALFSPHPLRLGTRLHTYLTRARIEISGDPQSEISTASLFLAPSRESRMCSRLCCSLAPDSSHHSSVGGVWSRVAYSWCLFSSGNGVPIFMGCLLSGTRYCRDHG